MKLDVSENTLFNKDKVKMVSDFVCFYIEYPEKVLVPKTTKQSAVFDLKIHIYTFETQFS